MGRSTLAAYYFSPLSRMDLSSFFFFNDPAPTEIYTLSLHDALPIYASGSIRSLVRRPSAERAAGSGRDRSTMNLREPCRSEEHTSELQSQSNLVCRLLLEKKKKQIYKVSDPI